MTFFIMGGTGFVGLHLITWLLEQGHRVTALARGPKSAQRLPASCQTVLGDPLRSGPWQSRAGQCDVVINLVGRSIMTRWSAASKQEIMNTRVLSTRMAVAALLPDRATTLINANAVGYYPLRGDEEFTETDPPGSGFLAEVCQRWQEEAEEARQKGARVVIARFASVLGQGGGPMPQLLPLFQKGLGGRLGRGNQWFTWIHVLDLCRALEFAAQHEDIAGPMNCCAPRCVTNAEFTRALGRVLRRPTIFPAPAFAIRLLLGEVAQVVLQGVKVTPKVLERAGFTFLFPDLEAALRDLVHKETT